MSNRINECTGLAEEILKNIELSEIPMANIILKCLRLCRLLNDPIGTEWFTYETSGYPKTDKGFLTSDAWRVSKLAGRHYFEKEKDKDKEPQEKAFIVLIPEIEEQIVALKLRLTAATDPNISISSANPSQYVSANHGNSTERTYAIRNISENTERLSKVRGCIYKYVLDLRNNLVYGNVVEDLFTRFRAIVDNRVQELCPDAIKKFMSAYENLSSENSEDWANAVHSCRRILKDVADNLYPPTDDIVVKGKPIKLGEEQYINRLIQYIESNTQSESYKSVVGSSLASIGERIDSIYNATNKGTHTEVTKAEAERYIIYTYLLIGDLLSLKEKNESDDK